MTQGRTPDECAEYMVKTYGEDKACRNAADSAFSYDRGSPPHVYWTAVIAGIDRIIKARKLAERARRAEKIIGDGDILVDYLREKGRL